MNENFAKTSNDSQRQSTTGRWDRTRGPSQRPWTTVKDDQRPCRFIFVIWKQNKIPLATANDRERPITTGSE